MTTYGPPGASTNGFNENLSLFQQGKCGMWIDATVAASFVTNPQDSDRCRQRRLCPRAQQGGSANAPTGSGPGRWRSRPAPRKRRPRRQFIDWATSKDYIELVAENEGWANVPPGSRTSLYENAELRRGAVRQDDAATRSMRPIPTTRPSIPCPMSASSSPRSRNWPASAPPRDRNSRPMVAGQQTRRRSA